MVGSNAGAPDQVELLSVTGTALGAIGPHNASAAAMGSNGNMFFALPGDSSSTVQEYDAAQNLISSFVFAPLSDPRPSAAYIEDMTWGPGGWIWISTFSGNVYSVSTAGVLQGSFDTGTSSPGIATDGTFLYTTEGAGFLNPASHFYRRDTSGNILDSIDTGLNDTLGIGFDSESGTFWIGGFDMLSRVDGSGNVLDQFAVDGVHTGVEVTSSPEPATFVLIAFSLATPLSLQRKKAPENDRLSAAAICASSLRAAVAHRQSAFCPPGHNLGATLTSRLPHGYRCRAIRVFALGRRRNLPIVRDFHKHDPAWTPADSEACSKSK
jgi:hypothetical protein